MGYHSCERPAAKGESPVYVRELGTCLSELPQGRNGVLRVTYALHVDGSGIVVDSGRKLLWCLAMHKLDSNVELLEENCGVARFSLQQCLGTNTRLTFELVVRLSRQAKTSGINWVVERGGHGTYSAVEV